MLKGTAIKISPPDNFPTTFCNNFGNTGHLCPNGTILGGANTPLECHQWQGKMWSREIGNKFFFWLRKKEGCRKLETWRTLLFKYP